MSIAPYLLLDSGHEQRLEQFGPYRIIRPCHQAVWRPRDPSLWKQVDALFTREEGNQWKFYKKIPSSWEMKLEDLIVKIVPTDFGHLGVFPEHHAQWDWMISKMNRVKHQPNILNLFAYSGAATLKLAKHGAKVCHLDASKKAISWAVENATLNHLENAPIRWIIDDVLKFLRREIKRGVTYDGIVLDPPSFGKGSQGEVFKIENDILVLLELCSQVLKKEALFVLFTCHTPGFTPSVMEYLMKDMMGNKGKIESGEMLVPSKTSVALPSGVFARWSYE